MYVCPPLYSDTSEYLFSYWCIEHGNSCTVSVAVSYYVLTLFSFLYTEKKPFVVTDKRKSSDRAMDVKADSMLPLMPPFMLLPRSAL